ncbi:binding-protein-dependent transport systems inner membrane component [Thermoanaerobacter pseudethanolicus ATCC 33223]|jgi:arabinogalactan oligomer/maltooligosaccharide transport system permease protein|uniref:Binding-protein-dependent transport systems inner membrane component n=3 Tax=Thermoanaerobacteraceae TaxID=186814 RepID=B0K7T5_THEP3|nr:MULTISPECIES: sugar ABC transporter permease [Thermoanaerobacteraceae]ABY94334.1 binding-protein-dependent transport systems inner membrane component [Thermoanaerobacter pseudethanolicus ATCC 33223]ADV79283.1 binding-protein-dependent transport systems inner membrane component [Thermoanaerobacter brockii subsp. finnii Ako-1]MDI3519902.1 arabinogalactan oligomer / maltooligosaccharide transport system permease protein [Caldanaerobacter sp.]HBW60116.1 sugar ABC transporter permease [Thermoanae
MRKKLVGGLGESNMGNKKKKNTFLDFIRKMIIYILLITLSFIVIIPIIWIIGSSLNPGDTLFSSTLIPKNPSLVHYKTLLTNSDFPLWYKNTLKIATANMIVSVFLSTSTAYVFSRYRFMGRKSMLMTILVLQMFPSFLAMTAIYVLLLQLGLLDTHLGLILVYATGQIPYNTWVAKGYFDGIPRSMDEAAKIDGASNFTIFYKIILPLAKPIITFIALTNFTGPWMDFVLPKLILRSADKKTLAMGLYDMAVHQHNTKFTLFAAGAVLVAIPITLLFVYLQKHIVEGLTKGAVKI